MLNASPAILWGREKRMIWRKRKEEKNNRWAFAIARTNKDRTERAVGECIFGCDSREFPKYKEAYSILGKTGRLSLLGRVLGPCLEFGCVLQVSRRPTREV